MNSLNISELFESLNKSDVKKKTFSIIDNKTITYKQLLSEIDKLHVLFQNNGLKKGDKIILSTQDDYYTSLFFIAFLKFGIVTIFLDPDVPLKRAISIINKANANGFIMDIDLFISRKKAIQTDLFQLKIEKPTQKKGKLFNRLLKKKTETETETETAPVSFPSVIKNITQVSKDLEQINPTDLAYVLFTSGTTSAPKGVMITHNNLFTHLKTLSNAYSLNENSRILNILMLYHVDGIIQGPMLTLFNQACWVRPFRFDLAHIEKLFNSIYKYRITHFITVPTILSFMNKFSEGYEDSFTTEDFKFIISVAAKLEKKLWEDVEDKFKIQLANVYGLTESVTGSIFSLLKPSARKVDSIGLPIDCEVKLTNKNDDILTEINKEGNLWIKGAHIFEGYLNDKKATEKVLKNGWLDTGDLATFDEKGFYKITGRAKNVIISGGFNIYPEQITEMINTHPQILESICIGLPDDSFGEKLTCALVLKENCILDKLELIAFLRPLLEQNQLPKEYYFFKDLPKGLAGKIQINKIQQLIEQQEIEDNQGNQKSYLEAVKTSASEAFGIQVSSIKSNDNSNSLEGWDSMGHLLFITNLEKHFNIQFSTSEMMTMHSIETSERILNSKLN